MTALRSQPEQLLRVLNQPTRAVPIPTVRQSLPKVAIWAGLNPRTLSSRRSWRRVFLTGLMGGVGELDRRANGGSWRRVASAGRRSDTRFGLNDARRGAC